ncbi:MAG: hypothetical protein JNN03_24215 [Rubrivivax sp.]|nr:hypothetical protein [Rubrivivax sp.]
MAHRLLLPNKPLGLPYLWNIDQHVGDQTRENRATDVELVKLLIKSALEFGRGGGEGDGYEDNPPLVLNGNFDQTLAFWVYRLQFTFRIEPKDGVISPVRRPSAGMAMLLQLNHQMRLRNGLFWADLASAPGISPGLRADLRRSV